MTNFPSKKTILITFLVLITWFSFKFVKEADTHFFQLNYNWNSEKTLYDFGDIKADSISYNFIDITFKNKKQFNPSNTYKLQNNKGTYYFRYIYSIIKNDNYKFYGVEWITETPNTENPNFLLSEIDLPLNQNNGIETITIGDKFLLSNEAKYFRKLLAQQDEVYFKGRYSDVFNYPHEALKINNSKSIIKQIDHVDNADNFILFFGSDDKAFSLEEIKNNITIIIEKLKVEKRAEEIIIVLLPPSTIDEDDTFNRNYNKILLEVGDKPNVKIIDSYTLFQDDLEKYIRADGFSLSKDAYYKLAKKVSER